MINGNQLVQVIFKIWPANKVQFDFERYQLFYAKKTKKKTTTYTNRRLICFTYRVSRNLNIHLFVFNQHQTWLTPDGFSCLINHLQSEFALYVDRPVQFQFKVTNLCTSFPLTESKFDFLTKSVSDNLITYLEEYFANLPHKPKLIPCSDGVNYSIFFKQLGSIKIWKSQLRGSSVCRNISDLKLIEDYFYNFSCKYGTNS